MRYTAARRRAIRRILMTRHITRQSDLVEQLEGEGYQVTQATVSRDLSELGAMKRRSSDGLFGYTLPDVPTPLEGSYETVSKALAQFAKTITSTGSLVVITTPPGAAQVVAGAVDGAGLVGVLGTVAGDDTLLVVVDEQVGGWRVAKELERIGVGR
ncbi:MAG: arginine repressor [Acidimicrobiia bacterium]|nr:arginine repressor [Acidimicrobiia bacterium]MDH3397827.1 arginine repressor [Acidimicrobiia bacterium]MDH5616002.1 arginine repressor [Acidimicrobiia bacterium]